MAQEGWRAEWAEHLSGGQGLGFFCRGEMVAAILSGHMGSALLADDSEVTPTSAQDALVAPRAGGEKP